MLQSSSKRILFANRLTDSENDSDNENQHSVTPPIKLIKEELYVVLQNKKRRILNPLTVTVKYARQKYTYALSTFIMRAHSHSYVQFRLSNICI